jgi:hypothetical protein
VQLATLRRGALGTCLLLSTLNFRIKFKILSNQNVVNKLELKVGFRECRGCSEVGVESVECGPCGCKLGSTVV